MENIKTKTEICEEYAKEVHKLFCTNIEVALQHVHKPTVEGIIFGIVSGKTGNEFHYYYVNENRQPIRKTM